MASKPEYLAPLANPLPPPPEGEPLTDEQWEILMSIMDTVIPSIHVAEKATDLISLDTMSKNTFDQAKARLMNITESPPDPEALHDYFAENVYDNAEFRDFLKRTLMDYTPADGTKGLATVLSTLNTLIGSYILTGYSTPFHKQSLETRTAVLESWRLSKLPVLPLIYKQMTFLAKMAWLKTSPTVPKATGFRPFPNNYKPGPHYEFEFMQFSAGPEPEVIETDVVIIGSGCGGGVSAKNIAEAGHRVLVVDKSYFFTPSHLPMTEKAGGIHLFENGGVVQSDDGSISVLFGSTWGGGGTVNWSASLQTDCFVRKEWAEDRGLKFFGTQEYQKCLDRVCQRMGVSTAHIRHNHANQMLLEGARKLGYAAKPVPQNTGGNEHYCGHCTVGCGSAQKQGPVITWLPDAARAGAKLAEGFKVEKVLFDESDGKKRAIGLKGLWTSRDKEGGVVGPLSERTTREVIVKAKKVIVSCGSIWSPVVLFNSGLDNPQIGRNLHLHPATTVQAIYPTDTRPWEGGILTSVCNAFDNLDLHGHGVKLETSVMLPSYSLTTINWTSGREYKLHTLKFRNATNFITIARDRDTGRIYVDRATGKPRIAYTPSKFDRANNLTGALALAKIAFVTGATEIHITVSGVPPYIRWAKDDSDAEEDDRFAAWLDVVQKAGNALPAASYASAHQMGSNRMSAKAEGGVVDPKGRVWGTEGLYVADASVLPSASGVNPMITTMATADWISRGVAKELNG